MPLMKFEIVFPAPNKKSYQGGHRGQTPKRVFSYNKILFPPPPPVVCYASLGQKYFFGRDYTPHENISAPQKWNLPLMKKSWTRLCS